MSPEARLLLCCVVVFGSILYGILVFVDSDLASAVALGYVSLLLTVFTIMHIGKRFHDRHL